jgi:membrane peptidoglycan carboxypeptidase
VKLGTGRRAYEAVKSGADPVVTVGKTGTTNEYKNVAFVGMVPKAGSGGRWGEGFTIAAYVGYDDNHPMKRGSFKVQGASGALPVWIATARGMAEAGLLERVAEYVPSPGLVRVAVPPATGMDARPEALVPDASQRRFALLAQPATLAAAPVEVAPTPTAPEPSAEPSPLPQDLAPPEPSIWDGL